MASGSRGRGRGRGSRASGLGDDELATLPAVDLVAYLNAHPTRGNEYARVAVELSGRERRLARAAATLAEAVQLADSLRAEIRARDHTAAEAEAEMRRAAETEARLLAEIRDLERRAAEAEARLRGDRPPARQDDLAGVEAETGARDCTESEAATGVQDSTATEADGHDAGLQATVDELSDMPRPCPLRTMAVAAAPAPRTEPLNLGAEVDVPEPLNHEEEVSPVEEGRRQEASDVVGDEDGDTIMLSQVNTMTQGGDGRSAGEPEPEPGTRNENAWPNLGGDDLPEPENTPEIGVGQDAITGQGVDGHDESRLQDEVRGSDRPLAGHGEDDREGLEAETSAWDCTESEADGHDADEISDLPIPLAVVPLALALPAEPLNVAAAEVGAMDVADHSSHEAATALGKDYCHCEDVDEEDGHEPDDGDDGMSVADESESESVNPDNFAIVPFHGLPDYSPSYDGQEASRTSEWNEPDVPMLTAYAHGRGDGDEQENNSGDMSMMAATASTSKVHRRATNGPSKNGMFYKMVFRALKEKEIKERKSSKSAATATSSQQNFRCWLYAPLPPPESGRGEGPDQGAQLK